MLTSITKPDTPAMQLCRERQDHAVYRTTPQEAAVCTAKGAARRPVPVLLSQLPGLVAAGVKHWWQVRRDTAFLARADASMLRDLGIARGNIESAVRHGRR
jgi:uncharacterized protein YjiS (DUF1127 family)